MQIAPACCFPGGDRAEAGPDAPFILARDTREHERRHAPEHPPRPAPAHQADQATTPGPA
jgi:hypothetical protein